MEEVYPEVQEQMYFLKNADLKTEHTEQVRETAGQKIMKLFWLGGQRAKAKAKAKIPRARARAKSRYASTAQRKVILSANAPKP